MVYRQAVMKTAGGIRRLPGLLFLAIVILAIAALLAGYGVPVGVGALAGLLLGAIAGVLGSLWLARGAGRSINLAGVEWSSDMQSGAMSAELLGDARDVRGVHDRPRVDPRDPARPHVGRGERARGPARSDRGSRGGREIALDVRALPGALPPPSSPQVSVTDGIGTQYRASGQGQGGGLGQTRYEIVVVPALVLTSGALTTASTASLISSPAPVVRRLVRGSYGRSATGRGVTLAHACGCTGNHSAGAAVLLSRRRRIPGTG